MTSTPNKKLDSYFMKFVSNPKLPNFIYSFFGQDKVWVKAALKSVLPENTSDEDLTNAANSLYDYKYQQKILVPNTNIDDFFRELCDK
jgi:hypothetical protein